MALTRRQLLKRSGLGLGAVLFAGCTIPDREMVVQSPASLPEDLVEGFDAHYATLCRVCSNPEGILVRVMEGRAKKVEGNPEYPLNLGKHGARCEAGLQALYHPDRIRMPMLRSSRGEPLREVSWDTALNTLVGRLRAQEANAASVAVITAPARGHMGMLVERFVRGYGAQHFAFETLEETVLREAVKRVFGQDRMPHFDIERASYVLSFGADFLGTWLSPINYSRQYGEFRQGEARGGLGRGTLVQVEPRFSLTAANADEWVPVRPGYEGALALSIASVIVDDGLADAGRSAGPPTWWARTRWRASGPEARRRRRRGSAPSASPRWRMRSSTTSRAWRWRGARRARTRTDCSTSPRPTCSTFWWATWARRGGLRSTRRRRCRESRTRPRRRRWRSGSGWRSGCAATRCRWRWCGARTPCTACRAR